MSRVRRRRRAWNAGVEPQREHVAAGADRGGTRRAIEQLGFAEAVAGAEHVERDLVAGRALFDHASAARDEDVERVGRGAFGGDHRAEGKRSGGQTGARSMRPRVVGQKAKDRQFVENATIADHVRLCRNARV